MSKKTLVLAAALLMSVAVLTPRASGQSVTGFSDIHVTDGSYYSPATYVATVATELSYPAAYYYNAWVSGSLSGDTYWSSSTSGGASATVSTYGNVGGSFYQLWGEHRINATYWAYDKEHQTWGYWDPYGFSWSYGGGGSSATWYGSQYNATYLYSPQISLGSTAVNYSVPPPQMGAAVDWGGGAHRDMYGYLEIYGQHFGGVLWYGAQSDGNGVYIDSIIYVSDWLVNVSYHISADAGLGQHWVTVTTGAGTSGLGYFQVAATTPHIDSIQDNYATRGGQGSLTVYGTELDVNAQLWIDGVSAYRTYATRTQATFSYTISESVSAGSRSAYVTTSAGTSNSLSFTIYDPPPQITSVTEWYAAGTFPITIYGNGFGANPNVWAEPGVSFTPTYTSDKRVDGMITISIVVWGVYLTVEAVGAILAPGTSHQTTVPITPTPLVVSQSPSSFNMSTGDTDKSITVTVQPSQAVLTRVFSQGLLRNPNSDCNAQISIATQTGSGTTTHQVTVPSQYAGCSGVFGAIATANGIQSSGDTTITIPPQILIKMIIGEAGGETDTAMRAVGVAARNRIYPSQDPLFPGQGTYQTAIIPSQFQGATNATTNGPEPPLTHAADVYDQRVGDIVAGSRCFWSPTAPQWATVQTALQSGTTTFPSGTGGTTCYADPAQRQIVYKVSVGNNSNGCGAPAFLFLRPRSASDPAVVQID
jgi:hypothetical protein